MHEAKKKKKKKKRKHCDIRSIQENRSLSSRAYPRHASYTHVTNSSLTYLQNQMNRISFGGGQSVRAMMNADADGTRRLDSLLRSSGSFTTWLHVEEIGRFQDTHKKRHILYYSFALSVQVNLIE